MAYQRINVPLTDMGPSIGEYLVQAAQAREKREADLATKLRNQRLDARQAQQDFQADYMKANQLASHGDYAGAQALMARYGAQMGQREMMGGQPPAAPGPMMPTAPGTGTGEMSDAAEESAIQQRLNPLAAAAQAGQTQNKKLAQILRGQFGDQSWAIDPEAARQSRGEQLDTAFGGSQDALTKELYPQMRPALVASNQGVDPTDVFKYFQNEKASRAATARQAQSEELADKRMNLQEAMAVMRDKRSDENNRRMAAAILGGAGIRAKSMTHEKPETGEGLKAEGQAERILDAANTLDQLPPLDPNDRDVILKHLGQEDFLEKNPGARVLAQGLGAYKTLPEKLSEGGNQYWTQIQEIGAAILRKESGAAISAEEWRNIFMRYAPVRGDSPAVIAQKRQNMYKAIKALSNESRRGGAALKQRAESQAGGQQATPDPAADYKEMYRKLTGGK